jgi:hypothetical protein
VVVIVSARPPSPDEDGTFDQDAAAAFAALGGTLTGDELLREVHRVLTRYVVFPSPEAADAVTLYIPATHAQPAWQHATRLVVKSAEKRCGKTRLFEVSRELVYSPVPTVNISAASLVHSIDEDDPPTFICDEADRIFGGARGTSETAEIVTGILNAGFARGWPYRRWDPTIRDHQECPTFAMAMLATKGADLPDTIEDRAVIITMQRKLDTDPVTKFRRKDIWALRTIRDQVAQWVIPQRDQLEDATPAMPDGLDDRAEDCWEPLLAVADLAGGDWPQRARRAARMLAGERAEADWNASYGVRLITDIRDMYDGLHLSFMSSRDTVIGLRRLDEAPWRDLELTTRGLADRLRPFGVRPRRNTAGTERGYRREDLADTFARYAPPPSEPVKPSETASDLRGSSDGFRASDTSKRQTTPKRQTLTSQSDGLTVSDTPLIADGI